MIANHIPNVGPGPLARVHMAEPEPKNVLLVDDSENDKNLIFKLTESYNCNWTWARDYDSAAAEIAKHGKGYFKLIFLDLKLGSGFDDCFRVFTLIKATKVAPVMILTGNMDARINGKLVTSQLLKIGLAGFVEKPSNFNSEYFEELFALVDIKPKTR